MVVYALNHQPTYGSLPLVKIWGVEGQKEMNMSHFYTKECVRVVSASYTCVLGTGGFT